MGKTSNQYRENIDSVRQIHDGEIPSCLAYILVVGPLDETTWRKGQKRTLKHTPQHSNRQEMSHLGRRTFSPLPLKNR